MKTITQRTIWLTGASSGIGHALAIRLADMGNFVIVSARRKAVLESMEVARPNLIKALPMDVSDSLSLQRNREYLNEVTDQLDMVIMAAGIAEYEDDLSFDPSLYERVFDVNFHGIVNTLSLALPLLKKSEAKAHIVGISSLSVVVGLPRAEAYGASKAAMEYLLNALRTDLPPKHYDVTVVRPGFVSTPMTAQNDFPMPFELPVEQAVAAIVKGIARRKRQVSFPWQLNLLLKFASWFPSLWYKVLAPKMSRSKL